MNHSHSSIDKNEKPLEITCLVQSPAQLQWMKAHIENNQNFNSNIYTVWRTPYRGRVLGAILGIAKKNTSHTTERNAEMHLNVLCDGKRMRAKSK